MTEEQIEQLKKDHDFAIIPMKNIVAIRELNDILEGNMAVMIKPDIETGDYMQFVDSDYFVVGWGKR